MYCIYIFAIFQDEKYTIISAKTQKSESECTKNILVSERRLQKATVKSKESKGAKMNKLGKKLLVTILTGSMVFSGNSAVFAASTSNEVSEREAAHSTLSKNIAAQGMVLSRK